MTFTRPKVVSEDVKLSERAQASKVGYNRKADATGRRLGCDFMNAGTLAGNDSLRAALRHYDEVRETYLRALAEHGVEFAPAGSSDAEIAQLRDELAQRGAEFRNAGASIRMGWISKACIECTGNKGSETFSTTFRCHRDCYFCFNCNQPHYEHYFDESKSRADAAPHPILRAAPRRPKRLGIPRGADTAQVRRAAPGFPYAAPDLSAQAAALPAAWS